MRFVVEKLDPYVVLCISLVIGCFLSLMVVFVRPRIIRKLSVIGLVICVSGFIFAWKFSTGILSQPSALVDKKSGNVIEDLPLGPWMWKFDPRLQQHYLISYSTKAKVIVAANPASGNRSNIKFEVEIKKENPSEPSVVWVSKLSDFHYNAERWLKFHLLEFAKVNEAQLVSLYNAESKKQHQQFYELLAKYFEPQLKDTGIIIVEAKFRN